MWKSGRAGGLQVREAIRRRRGRSAPTMRGPGPTGRGMRRRGGVERPPGPTGASSRPQRYTVDGNPRPASCRAPSRRPAPIRALSRSRDATSAGGAASRSSALRSSARPTARRRSCCDSARLRSRIDSGVTSTSSSPAMNSRALSSVIGRGRRQAQRLVVRVRPDVGELLLLGRVDVHVARAAVLADDHPLVDLDARRR